jgi:hypothetical protein
MLSRFQGETRNLGDSTTGGWNHLVYTWVVSWALSWSYQWEPPYDASLCVLRLIPYGMQTLSHQTSASKLELQRRVSWLVK